MSSIIATVLQVVLVLLLAPFAQGCVRWTKARLQGRKGASPFLPYVTFATMAKKEIVIPEASSWVFRAVPFVVLSSTVALTFVLPLLFSGARLASLSDFLIVAGILIVGSVFLVLGGIDPGSAFGGMGSSREMTIAALVEPTMIMIFAAISFASGTNAIDGMVASNAVLAHPYLLLSLIALILVALAENARYPVDNPATHLELTMVHEAMILEYSGPYLAMLEYASAIKLTVFALLIANFLLPMTVLSASAFTSGGLFFAAIVTFAKIAIAMMLLGLLETTIVKMRFYRMSEYHMIAFFVALFGMLFALLASITSIALPYHTIFSAFAVILSVLLFGHVRLKAMVRYYAFSSLAIAGIAAGLATLLPKEEQLHLWIYVFVTVVIKAIGVPQIISHMTRAKKSLTNLPSFLRPATRYLFAVLLMLVTFFILKQTPFASSMDSLLFAAVTLIILGLAMLVVQRNIFAQIMGLLILENGIAVFVLATVESLPLLIEMGVFLTTALTAFILSRLTARIKEFHGSPDTEKLRSLTE